MADDKFKEYPCVKVSGIIHITISGNKCKCGKNYRIEPMPESKDTLVVKSSLLWRTLPEVTCWKCKERAMEER